MYFSQERLFGKQYLVIIQEWLLLKEYLIKSGVALERIFVKPRVTCEKNT